MHCNTQRRSPYFLTLARAAHDGVGHVCFQAWLWCGSLTRGDGAASFPTLSVTLCVFVILVQLLVTMATAIRTLADFDPLVDI